jgi:hypothetical protein
MKCCQPHAHLHNVGVRQGDGDGRFHDSHALPPLAAFQNDNLDCHKNTLPAGLVHVAVSVQEHIRGWHAHMCCTCFTLTTGLLGMAIL